MNRTLRSCFIVLNTLLSFSLSAQTITVKSEHGELLSNAHIELKKNQVFLITDSLGKADLAKFQNTSPKDLLRISHLGFSALDIHHPNGDTTVVLRQEVVALKEVRTRSAEKEIELRSCGDGRQASSIKFESGRWLIYRIDGYSYLELESLTLWPSNRVKDLKATVWLTDSFSTSFPGLKATKQVSCSKRFGKMRLNDLGLRQYAPDSTIYLYVYFNFTESNTDHIRLNGAMKEQARNCQINYISKATGGTTERQFYTLVKIWMPRTVMDLKVP